MPSFFSTPKKPFSRLKTHTLGTYRYPKTPVRPSGFTLIEILIVFSIMALLFGLSIANYRGFQDRQRLMSAVRSLKGDLRFAQEQALAGVKPEGCVRLDGYRVSWESASEYEIHALCDGNLSGIEVKAVDLSSNFTGIRFNTAFTAVTFNVLGRGVRNPVTITLRDSKSPPNVSQITISTGGEID